MKLCVISGAQTGADVAGLWCAKHFGISTGGWAPRGFITLDGAHPEMEHTFQIKEHQKNGYRDRTISNLKESNVTIICSEKMSPGTRLTLNQCSKEKIFNFLIRFDPSNLEDSLNNIDNELIIQKIKRELFFSQCFNEDTFTINVAGNSTQNSSRAFEFTYKFCYKLFTELGYTSSVPISDWKLYKDIWK